MRKYIIKWFKTFKPKPFYPLCTIKAALRLAGAHNIQEHKHYGCPTLISFEAKNKAQARRFAKLVAAVCGVSSVNLELLA